MDSSRRVCAASHGHRERSRGQAAVEFALILPVFMLLLLLAVDFGRLFFTYIQLNNTAREGAAYAAFNPTTSNGTLTTIALREANVQAQRGEGAVTATAECVDSSGTALACSSALGGSGAGNRVTVTVGETFTFLSFDRQRLAGRPASRGICHGGRGRLGGWRWHAARDMHNVAADPELHMAESRSSQPSEPHLRRCGGFDESGQSLSCRWIQLGLRWHEH